MNNLKNNAWVLSLALLATVGCSKDNGTPDTGNNGSTDRYFISAQTDEASYTFVVDDLEKDTIVDTRSAIESTTTGNRFVYNGTTAVMSLNYQQGNPSPGVVYQLNNSGVLRTNGDFVLPVGFTTIGAFDKYLVASRSGRTLNVDGGTKTGVIYYYIDTENNNQIIEKSVVTENFIGNRTAELTGVVDAGNKEFLVGVMLSAPTGQTASVDSVYAAKLDENLNVKAIYRDSRLSYSTGTFRSARYSHIANDETGNTYVFSGSHAAATTKKAGALLISKGSDTFDANYYFDIETASQGYRFKRVWHVAEDYFLLEMYNEVGVAGGQQPASQYAIVQMSTKKFTWIRAGIPAASEIDGIGWPFTSDGKAYLGITASNAQPAVYVIDPKTATAKKGITVTGMSAIQGLARLSPQSNLQ